MTISIEPNSVDNKPKDDGLIESQSMPIINEAALENSKGNEAQFDRITKPDYVEKAYVPKENPLLTELDKAEQTKDRNIWEDSFRLNNSVGSAWNYFSEPDYKGQNGYSAYEMDKDLLQGLSLDEYKDVIDARSHEELVGRLTRIHDENMTRKHIAESGFEGVVAGLLTSVVDPINLVPIIGQSTKAKVAWGVATAALDEGILQATQENRSGVETAINIGTAGVMTGVLSGIASKYGGSKSVQQLNEGITDTHHQIDYVPIAKSGGAASTPNNLLLNQFSEDETKIVGGYATKFATSGPFGGVGAKLMTSDNAMSRYWTNELVDHGFVTVGHTKGKATTNVYSTIEFTKNKWSSEITAANKEGFYEFVTSTQGKGIANTQDDFFKLVNRELRYGDVAEELAGQAGIQGVKRLADSIRKMYDEFGKVLHEAGKISNPDNVYGAVHFAPRDYQKDFMRLNQIETIDKLADLIERKWKAEPLELERAMDISEGSFSDIKQEARDVAKSIYMSIVDGKSEFPSTSGRRKLRLEDKDLMFLINDNPIETAFRYAQKTIPKVEMLNRFGHYDVNKFVKEIHSRYLDDYEKAFGNGKKLSLIDKANAALMRKQFEDDKQNITVMFNRLMGNSLEYGGRPNFYSDSLKFANNLLTSELMGKALFSALGDVGGNVMINGPIRTMEQYGKALLDITNLSSATGQISRKQIKKLSNSWEQAMSERSMDFAEIMNDSTGPVNDFMAKTSQSLMKYSGLPQWTNFGQGVGATLSVDKILRNAESLASGGKLKQSEITFLAQHGLTTSDLDDILKASQKFGDVKNRILNVDSWTDRELAAKFGSAVIRMRDTGVVTVNPATLPAFMDIPEMRLFFKFQSFAWAAWQRITVAGLQRHDANFLFGSTAMLGMSMVNVKLRAELFGNKEPETWDQWLSAGVQSSGIALFPVQMYDKLGGFVGLIPSSKMLENSKNYGYQEGKPDLIRFVGPVGQLSKNGSTVLNGIFDRKERWDQEEIDATRRLLPFNNLWWASNAVDQFNRGWAGAIGVPYKTKDNLINNFIENK
jgi:hypothetical protein